MSADSLIAFILLGCIFMFAIGIGISSWIERAWGGLADPPTVKPSPTEGTAPHADYVERRGDDGEHNRTFRTSRPEAEVEGTRKLAGGSTEGMVVLTQNALQAQLDDATRDGMVRSFAAIYRGGYLVPGKVSLVKQALFGVSGGRKLQGLNAAIDAVVVPAPQPEPPQKTPLAQRPVPAGMRFAGELADELAQE